MPSRRSGRFSAWQRHAATLNALFADFERQYARPAAEWARSALAGKRKARVVFYPFSGPDFTFAHLLFPAAETYILCGLESCEAAGRQRGLREWRPGAIAGRSRRQSQPLPAAVLFRHQGHARAPGNRCLTRRRAGASRAVGAGRHEDRLRHPFRLACGSRVSAPDARDRRASASIFTTGGSGGGSSISARISATPSSKRRAHFHVSSPGSDTSRLS